MLVLADTSDNTAPNGDYPAGNLIGISSQAVASHPEKSCCSRAFPQLCFPELCQRQHSIQTLLFSFSEATSGLQLTFWCSQVPSSLCHPLKPLLLSLPCSSPGTGLRWSSHLRNHPRNQLKRDLIWNNQRHTGETNIWVNFSYATAVFSKCPTESVDPRQVCRDRESLSSREGFLSLKYKKSQFSLHRKPLLGLSSALMCVIHSNISLHTFSSLKLFILPWIHLSGEENILLWQRKYTHLTC